MALTFEQARTLPAFASLTDNEILAHGKRNGLDTSAMEAQAPAPLTLGQVRQLPAFADKSDAEIIEHGRKNGLNTSAMEAPRKPAGTLGAYGQTLLQAVKGIPSYVASSVEGATPFDESNILDTIQQDQKGLNANFISGQNANAPVLGGLATEKDIRQTAGSLSGSIAGMAPTMAGAAIGSVFGPIGTAVGGLAGAGLGLLGMKRSAENQFVRDTIAKENDKLQSKGLSPLTQAQSIALQNELNATGDTSKIGYSEALPETAGNIAEAIILATPIGKVAKGISTLASPLVRAAATGLAKAGSSVLTEMGEEEITRQLQNPIMQRHGFPEQTASDTAKQTMIATAPFAALGGGAGAYQGYTQKPQGPLARAAAQTNQSQWQSPEYKINPDAEAIVANNTVPGQDIQSAIDSQYKPGGYNPLSGTWETPVAKETGAQDSKAKAFHQQEQEDLQRKENEYKAMETHPDATPEQVKEYRKKRIELENERRSRAQKFRDNLGYTDIPYQAGEVSNKPFASLGGLLQPKTALDAVNQDSQLNETKQNEPLYNGRIESISNAQTGDLLNGQESTPGQLDVAGDKQDDVASGLAATHNELQKPIQPPQEEITNGRKEETNAQDANAEQGQEAKGLLENKDISYNLDRTSLTTEQKSYLSSLDRKGYNEAFNMLHPSIETGTGFFNGKKLYAEGSSTALDEPMEIGDTVYKTYAGAPNDFPHPWKLIDAENYFSGLGDTNNVRVTIQAANGKTMQDEARGFSKVNNDSPVLTLPQKALNDAKEQTTQTTETQPSTPGESSFAPGTEKIAEAGQSKEVVAKTGDEGLNPFTGTKPEEEDKWFGTEINLTAKDQKLSQRGLVKEGKAIVHSIRNNGDVAEVKFPGDDFTTRVNLSDTYNADITSKQPAVEVDRGSTVEVKQEIKKPSTGYTNANAKNGSVEEQRRISTRAGRLVNLTAMNDVVGEYTPSQIEHIDDDKIDVVGEYLRQKYNAQKSEQAQPSNQNGDLSEGLKQPWQQTLPEYLAYAEKEIGNKSDFDNMKSHLIDEHYAAIEASAKAGNKIPKDVIDSQDTGKQYHFAKHYGENAIEKDAVKEAELAKQSEEYSAKVLKGLKEQEDEQKAVKNAKGTVAIKAINAEIDRAQNEVNWGRSTNERVSDQEKDKSVKDRQLRLDTAIKQRDKLFADYPDLQNDTKTQTAKNNQETDSAAQSVLDTQKTAGINDETGSVQVQPSNVSAQKVLPNVKPALVQQDGGVLPFILNPKTSKPYRYNTEDYANKAIASPKVATEANANDHVAQKMPTGKWGIAPAPKTITKPLTQEQPIEQSQNTTTINTENQKDQGKKEQEVDHTEQKQIRKDLDAAIQRIGEHANQSETRKKGRDNLINIAKLMDKGLSYDEAFYGVHGETSSESLHNLLSDIGKGIAGSHTTQKNGSLADIKPKKYTPETETGKRIAAIIKETIAIKGKKEQEVKPAVVKNNFTTELESSNGQATTLPAPQESAPMFQNNTPKKWTEVYDSEQDILRKNSILRQITDVSNSSKELSNVMDRLELIKDNNDLISGTAYAVLNNNNANKETKRRAFQLTDHMLSLEQSDKYKMDLGLASTFKSTGILHELTQKKIEQESTPTTPLQESSPSAVTKDLTKITKTHAKVNAKGKPVAKPEPVALLDKHTEINKRINTGNITAEELKSEFENLVANKEAVYAELNKLSKDEIVKRYGAGYLNSSDKKDRYVSNAYQQILMGYRLQDGMFSYGMGKDAFVNSLRNDVNKTTDADIENYAREVKQAEEQLLTKQKEVVAGMENPQTLDDYVRIMGYKVRTEGKTYANARMELTPEQREQFDTLAADKSRTERQAKASQQKTEVRAVAQTTEGQIVETTHTKTGEPLFVVKANDRVDREIYNQWNATAKRLGGYYSSYKGNGAVPGFTFKTRDNADAFLKFLGGDVEQAKEVMQERRDSFADDKSQSAVERLNEMADRLEDKADESLSRDRRANTTRRIGIAARAEANAEYDKSMAKTMRNIATAIDNGTAKLLDLVRQKTQVEMLQGFVHSAHYIEATTKHETYGEQEKLRQQSPTKETADYVEFPNYTAMRSDLSRLGRALLETEGTKLLGKRMMEVADDVNAAYLKFAKENLNKVHTFTMKGGTALASIPTKPLAEAAILKGGFKGKAIVLPFKRGENLIILSPAEAIKQGIWQGDNDKRITLSADFGNELVQKIGKAERRGAKISVPWQLENAFDKRKRLVALGIETPAELRAAIREFIGLREAPKEADKIKEMERAMVGRQNDGLDFFPTPANVADEMIATAGIEEGMTVLEPSAGMGHIAERIREAGVEPDVIELSNSRKELLEAKGFNVVGSDFMEFNEGGYDRIIMNPPFGDRRDSAHVQHAYDLLNPGGRLVAIMGEGVFFGSDKKAQAFRDWLEQVGGTEEKLPSGTFNDPSLPVNTSVNARLIVIEKAEQAGDDSLKFSRSQTTKENYEARIDELFANEKANIHGIKVLDKSDMLDMLGYNNQPVYLNESKVIDGKYNHGLKEDHWKKIPEWMDDPSLVFDSDTVDGRLVVIAPETLNGKLIKIIIEPNADVGGLTANFLVNGYDSQTDNKVINRWLQDGLLRYFDKEKSLELRRTAKLQLLGANTYLTQGSGSRSAGPNIRNKTVFPSRQGRNNYAKRSVLQKKDLVKYREGNKFSKSNDTAFAQEVLNELAEVDEMFRYPVSQATTIQVVMKDIAPDFKYIGEEAIQNPDEDFGADKKVLFRNALGKRFDVYVRGNELWIDVSKFSTGERGDAVYAAVGNYAYNTGNVFIADPTSMSDDATIRRTSAMLSLALRFGTTDFMEPGETQLKGNAKLGIAPLKWTGNDVDRTKALIHTFVTNIEHSFPEIKNARYDFNKRRFYTNDSSQPNGRNYDRTGAEALAGNARAGEATTRRGIFIRSLISSESSERPRILEHVLSRANSLVTQGGLKGIFSKGSSHTEKSTIAEVKSWLPRMVRKMLGANKLVVVQSVSQLPTELLGKGNALSQAIKNGDDLSGVEALYHNGTIYLIADSINKGNVHGILLHELFHRALATNPILKAAVNSFQEAMQERFSLAVEGNASPQENAAAKRVINAKTQIADQLEEFMAYQITLYNTNPKSLAAHVVKLIKDLIASIRMAMLKMGFSPDELTAADLNALAKMGAKVQSDSFGVKAKIAEIRDKIIGYQDFIACLAAA